MIRNKDRFVKLCTHIFNSPPGKELMEYLDDMLMASVAAPSLNSNYAYWREGQNDLIRRLKNPEEYNSTNPRGEND